MVTYFIPQAWGIIIFRFEKAFRFCKHPPKRLFQLLWQALSQKSNFESKIRFSRNVSKCVLDMIDGRKRCSEVRRVVWDRFGPIRTHQERFWKKTFFTIFSIFLKHFLVHFQCFLANFAEKIYKKSIFSKMKPLIKNRLDRIQDMVPYFIPQVWGMIISRYGTYPL